MVWQKIDDGFGIHRKVTRIPRKQRLEALGLWLLALNYSGRNGTNGLLEATDLEECLVRTPLMSELVRVGLWHKPGHECDDCEQPQVEGAVIHHFLVYNPDAASTAGEVEGKSQGGRYGNHVRWHETRGRRIAGCDWCESDIRSDTESLIRSDTNRISIASSSPGPVPGPDPLETDMTNANRSSHEIPAREVDDPIEVAQRERNITNLGRIRRAFRGLIDDEASDGEVIDLAGMVLDRARGFVDNPEAYIETAALKSRDEIGVYAAEVRARSPRPFPAHVSPQLVAVIREAVGA